MRHLTDSLYAAVKIISAPQAIACPSWCDGDTKCWLCSYRNCCSNHRTGDGAASVKLAINTKLWSAYFLWYRAKSDEPFKWGGRVPEPRHRVDMKPSLGLLPAIWLSQSVLALLGMRQQSAVRESVSDFWLYLLFSPFMFHSCQEEKYVWDINHTYALKMMQALEVDCDWVLLQQILAQCCWSFD